MNVAIIGTGYVGLPTGVGLAELGHQVVCIDREQSKIDALQAGKITLMKTVSKNFSAKIRKKNGSILQLQ